MSFETAAGEIGSNEVAQHIAGVASRLFAERGYDATSVREIVEASGVTKPTLYYHFGSKEGLAQALLTKPMQRLLETMRDLVATKMPPVARLERMLEAHFSFCREDPNRARFLFSIAFGPLGEPKLAAELMQFGESLHEVFREGVVKLAEAEIIAVEMIDRFEGILHGLKVVSAIDHIFCEAELEPGLANRLVSDVLLGCASLKARRVLLKSKDKSMASLNRKILTSIVVSSLAAGLAAGCGGSTKNSASRAPVKEKELFVPVARVRTLDVERTIDVVGTLRGWENVTIGDKNTGRVGTVYHDIGDRVKPGELLVQIEPEDADLGVLQAQKKLEVDLARLGLKTDQIPAGDFDVNRVPTVVEARVALERAHQVLGREQTLFDRKVNNLEVLQNAENDERSARAKLDTAALNARADLANVFAGKVALDLAKQKRIDTEIRVPKPSSIPTYQKTQVLYVVSKRDVSEGQMVKEGESMFQLVITDPLRLWVNVPERENHEIEIGQIVRVHVPSMKIGEFVAAKVARINPTVDSANRTFQVEIAVPNPDQQLRPGGFAKAEIVTKLDAKATIVPISSLIRSSGNTKVFVLDASGTSVTSYMIRNQKKEIKDLPGWVEVESDIPANAQVVTIDPKYQESLSDGAKIRVQVRVPLSEERSAAEAKSKAESAAKDKPAQTN